MHMLSKFWCWWWWMGWNFPRWCQHCWEFWWCKKKLTDGQSAKADKDTSCIKILKKNSWRLVRGGHLGQRAQPAVHAVLVKQQARLVKLRIPPIFLLHKHLSPTFLLVQTPQYPLSFYSAHSDLSLLLYAVVATGMALSGQALRRTALQPTTVSWSSAAAAAGKHDQYNGGKGRQQRRLVGKYQLSGVDSSDALMSKTDSLNHSELDDQVLMRHFEGAWSVIQQCDV